MSQDTQTTPNTPAFLAFHVPPRRKAPWQQIGAMWPHRDGKGFSLKLDLMPQDGRIELRLPLPKREGDTADSEGDQA